MGHPGIDDLHCGQQSGTAIRDDQFQLLALQAPSIEIFQQSLPGCLTLSLAPYKS
jgi:hypothetical protein